MPWCPNCKNEYREGITVCADCGVALVDESELTERVSLIFGGEEQMEDLKNFLVSNGIKSAAVKYMEEDDVYDLSVGEKEQSRADKMVRTFLMQVYAEAEAAENDEEEAAAQIPVRRKNAQPYQSKSSRAAENRSTAYTFLIIGILALAFTVLSHFGIIPFGFGDQIIMEIVAFALSIIFIFVGIISFKNASGLSEGAKDEEKLTEEILSWVKENLNGADIDTKLNVNPEDDDCYFMRYAAVKALISNKFEGLDEEYLDHLIDDKIFDSIFSEES